MNLIFSIKPGKVFIVSLIQNSIIIFLVLAMIWFWLIS